MFKFSSCLRKLTQWGRAVPSFPPELKAAPFVVVLCLLGCNTMHPLPPVDLSAQGWRIQEGQAVWRHEQDTPEIAGELLVATHPDGHALVQFSKNPFPMIVAQRTSRSWEVQVPTANRRYSGPGTPPSRLFWLYLPEILRGAAPPGNWTWKNLGNGWWRLANSRTGESLEGFLTR